MRICPSLANGDLDWLGRHWALQGSEDGETREGWISLCGQEGDVMYAKRGNGLMVTPRLYWSRVSPTS